MQGVVIAFFMIGFDTASLGFVILVSYFAYVAAESLASLVVLLTSPSTPLGVMVTQGFSIQHTRPTHKNERMKGNRKKKNYVGSFFTCNEG